MSSERPPGLLIVLSAPSGAGKTTLARRFAEAHPDAVFSVSATTRPRRGTEQDGVDYHFVEPSRFAALVAEGAFAEWAEVHGERYGTLRTTVEDALARGRIALFDIDVQGGSQIKSAWPREVATVFIVPPSEAELERRLRGRSTDSDDVVRRRLLAARGEVARGLATYDYVIVNERVDDSLACLSAIAAHERARLAATRDPAAEAIAARCRRGVVSVPGWSS